MTACAARAGAPLRDLAGEVGGAGLPDLIAGWSTFVGTGTGKNERVHVVYGRRFTVGFRVRY